MWRPRNITRYFHCFFYLAALTLIALNAVIIEDAYVSFRVADNFVHGYGLRWNVDERVQAYTNPLWTLLHIPFHYFFNNIFVLTVFLSVGCVAVGIYFLSRIERAPLMATSLLIALPLLLSKAYRDFLTSGLETPLNFMLFALFLWELFRRNERPNLYRLTFFAALCMVSRLDNILPLLPLMAWIGLCNLRSLRIGKFLLSASPILGWFAFSLIYYGFFLPNTKYAKLDTGGSAEQYIYHGLNYLRHFKSYDQVALGIIVIGLGIALFSFVGAVKDRLSPSSRATQFFMLGLGCVLNVAYVVRVGGDFMPARLLLNIVTICQVIIFMKVYAHIKEIYCVGAVLCGLFLQQIFVLDPILQVPSITDRKYSIDDQHLFFLTENNFFLGKAPWFRTEPTQGWVRQGKERTANATTPVVYVHGNIGLMGFFAGPLGIQIDDIGLADPLTARLPYDKLGSFRIAHVMRIVPEGYAYARKTGDLSQMDPDLAHYYEKLRLVVSGDLFTLDRWIAILGFQLDAFNKYRDDYLAKVLHG